MKLGGKSKDVDSFVDQLKSEGETVASDVTAMKSSKQVSKTVTSQSQIKTESVHAKVNGKINLFCN